jgi:glucose-1-phosphate cytidylyltransferase
MKVVILCGGIGTRLREETEFRPKPLVDVGGRPILWHIMKLYAHHGFREFVLCLGYRGNMIKEYFLNYEAMTNDFTVTLGRNAKIEYDGEHAEQDFRVTLAETGAESMTATRIRRAARYLDGTFLVTYGDGVSNVDITALLAFHRSHGKLATVTSVRPTSRFGVLDVADDGAVRSFGEKPQLDGWANAGFFVFEPGVLDYLPAEEDVMLEGSPLERLAADGQLRAFRHDGFFFAMDTYREYKLLNDLWAAGSPPWKVWE